MPFDEEELDPHGECAAEIHRLQAEVERLRRVLAKFVELDPRGMFGRVAQDALKP